VRAVLGAATMLVQVGGALDTEGAIDEMLSWGAARVVIGCAAAASEPALVERLVRRHGSGRLAVGIDAKDGRVAPRGRPAPSDMPARLLARIVHGLGARLAVYTDVTRDGTLTGPDITGALGIAMQGLEVVVSGGVGTLADIGAVREARLAGAIVGRALHDGRFTLAEALACATA